MADVNVGAAPNDGTGDALRTAFIKLNASISAVAGEVSELEADVSGLDIRAPRSLGSVGGTGDAISAASVPTLTSYEVDQMFYFTPSTANTGAVTIDIDGLGPREIRGATNQPLVAGDLVPGRSIILRNGVGRLLALTIQNVSTVNGLGAELDGIDEDVTNLQDGVSTLEKSAPRGLVNVGGTGDAFTAEVSPTLGSYATEQSFYFTPNRTNAGRARLRYRLRRPGCEQAQLRISAVEPCF